MRQLLYMMLEIHMMFVPRKGCSEKFRGKRLQLRVISVNLQIFCVDFVLNLFIVMEVFREFSNWKQLFL